MTDQPINFNPEFTPKDFIEQIDRKYGQLKGKEDRMSLKWGHFSRGMNLIIREYVKELPDDLKLKEQYHYTQIYWTCKSKLLDLHMKRKIFVQGKIKKEARMARDIKSMVLSGKFLTPVKENDVIANLLGKL